MSSPSYRYYITIGNPATGTTEHEVFPSGSWKLNPYKAEEDFPFCKDYRIGLSDDLIFSGDDYDLIIGDDCCNKIDIRITCDGKDYWFGYFSVPYDFKPVNEDTCQIIVRPKPLDKYYYYDLYADTKETGLARTDTFTYQNNFITAPPGDTWSVCLPCEPLWDILTQIGTTPPLWPVGFTGTLVSTFFQNDLFPDGTNPYPTNNYVTGFANKLNYIVMAMSEDIRTLETVVANLEDMPEWSWNDIMEIVHNVFNTWWYIDENGEIRIEHIYFWELYFGASYDLTTLDGGNWIVNTSEYDYRSEEMPKEEQWLWSDLFLNFQEIYYTYYGCFLPGPTRYIKEYQLRQLSTDLEYMAVGVNNFTNSPAIADVGTNEYMFIRCLTYTQAVAAGYIPTVCTYVAWFSRYLIDGNDHVNAHLSPANLLANYWMHDRPFWEGIMTVRNELVSFESTWKNLRQVEITFPTCCDGETVALITGTAGTDPRYLYQFAIDFLETITTQYGEGELIEGTIEDGMLRLRLIFEDTCGEGTTPTEWSHASDI